MSETTHNCCRHGCHWPGVFRVAGTIERGRWFCAAHAPTVRVCALCESEFLAEQPAWRYCGDECRRVARKRRDAKSARARQSARAATPKLDAAQNNDGLPDHLVELPGPKPEVPDLPPAHPDPRAPAPLLGPWELGLLERRRAVAARVRGVNVEVRRG